MLKKFISFAHHPRIPMQCVNTHRTRHRKCIYQCRVSELIHDWRYTTHLVLPLLLHTVGNLHFLSKNSTLISPRKLSIWGFLAVDNLSKKFGWKTRENVGDLHFLVVDNFDFTRKIVKLCQSWIFGQKFNFSNCVILQIRLWMKLERILLKSDDYDCNLLQKSRRLFLSTYLARNSYFMPTK